MRSRIFVIAAMIYIIALMDLALLAQDSSKTQGTTKTNDIRKLWFSLAPANLRYRS